MAGKRPRRLISPPRSGGFFSYLRSNNKLGVFFACVALFAAMIAAMLVPLAFRERVPEPDAAADYALKAELFAEYWASTGRGYTVGRINEPGEESEDFCGERFDELVEAFRVERAKNPEVTAGGSEYVELRGDGVSLRLCRKWVQYAGDWMSWLDVCFDMDTGEIFYLYTNGECIYNGSEYADTVFFADVSVLASALGEELGLELYHFAQGADAAGATAIYLDGGAPVKVDLSLTYVAGNLFDVKITCI